MITLHSITHKPVYPALNGWDKLRLESAREDGWATRVRVTAIRRDIHPEYSDGRLWRTIPGVWVNFENRDTLLARFRPSRHPAVTGSARDAR